MTQRSARSIAAACPNRKESSPPWLAFAGPLQIGQQHDAERKEHAERDAEPGVGLDAAVARQQHHQQRREHRGDQRAGEDAAEVARAGDDEAETDARQGRVRERIAEQALLAQHGEAAEHAADQAEQRRADDDVLDRVVAQEVEQRAHERTSIGACGPRSLVNAPRCSSAAWPP
jgi:hypothetical protein